MQQRHGQFLGTQEQLLLNEMSHRFKNDLTSIIGFISTASMRSKNVEARCVLEGILEKLYDQAKLVRALQMPSDNTVADASSYLRELLAAMSRARISRGRVRVVYRESLPIRCSSMQCWTLGLIVSELVRNSLKHAFANEGGMIGVDLVEDEGQIECRIADNGSCAAPFQEGNGLKIVRELVGNLRGAIDQCRGPNGTLSVVSFPRQAPTDRKRGVGPA